jgi:L-ribulose-5-phosphate 4-epimerase
VEAFEELRERAFAANLELVRAGLVLLKFGNASAADREAGVIAIKPSGVAYDELRPEQMPVLEIASGEVVAGTQRPSSDAPTHLQLYRSFPVVGGVVHTHSPFATAWAQAQRPLPCFGTTHADHFRGEVPVTRLLTADEIAFDYEARTGAAIVEAFAELGLDPLAVPAALVASHGPFTWGADVEAAVENAVVLEAVAAGAYRTRLLHPDPEPIQAELLAKHSDRKHGQGAYYGQPA